MADATGYPWTMEVVDGCTGRLRDHFGLGYITMPAGVIQALCETVAEITGCQYDLTPDGVEFGNWRKES